MDKLLSTSDSGDDRSISFVTPDEKDSGFESDWVKEPSENDVLCGRGGSINSHPGNERFRLLVEKRKRVYLTARFKREKRLIASSIVSEIRALKPTGRFLSRDAKTGKWKDIGDEKARDKTSQALRENAPSLRAEIETEIKEQQVDLLPDQDAPRIGSAPPSLPPPPPPYYSSWGYTGYYGYGHPPPPPPGHHPGYPPPPPPPHYDGHHWPPPHYPPPPYGARPGDPYHHPPAPSQPIKSTLEQTAEMVVSGAETLKSYFNFSSVNSVASHDGQDNQSHHSSSRASTVSKPIVYVHGSDKKRRMVKFREDANYPRKSKHHHHPSYSPVTVGASGNSLVDDADDLEPENIESAPAEMEANSSLMSHFANQIFNIGSWDNTLCGQDSTDDRVPFPRNSNPGGAPEHEYSMEQIPDEDMAVEWEGQEVLLVDKNEEVERESSPQRMPPPLARRPHADREHSSLGGFSSLGSCHSWIPEQLSGAASFFSGSHRGGISPAGSIDMEYSAAGTEQFSSAGSLGGSLGANSLTRVFEHETLEEQLPVSPAMSHRALNQVSSWERSVRSRSPLSLGSADDESLISKSSSKLSDSGVSHNKDNGMVWESHE